MSEQYQMVDQIQDDEFQEAVIERNHWAPGQFDVLTKALSELTAGALRAGPKETE